MSTYRDGPDQDLGYAVQGWSRKCVLPDPPSNGGNGGNGGGNQELGWFSIGSWGDTQAPMPPPPGVSSTSTAEFRYQGTSSFNRLAELTNGVWDNNPAFDAGIPWPPPGFTADSLTGTTEFSLWWWDAS